MSFKIENDYPEFRITDTLHQLVDRLNLLTDVVDSNTRVFDSSVNNILKIVDSKGDGLVNDSDKKFSAFFGTIDLATDSAFSIRSGTDLTLAAERNVFVDAGSKVYIDADSGEIVLRSQGTIFGGLKKVIGANELEILSGLDAALTFNATLDATVYGEINLPATGNGTPPTNSKTVSGAIAEIVQNQDSDYLDLDMRVDSNSAVITGLVGDIATIENTLVQLDSDLGDQQLLNIADRLTTIEAQIVIINDRLNVLEIFS
jgi:hypothetical protein